MVPTTIGGHVLSAHRDNHQTPEPTWSTKSRAGTGVCTGAGTGVCTGAGTGAGTGVCTGAGTGACPYRCVSGRRGRPPCLPGLPGLPGLQAPVPAQNCPRQKYPQLLIQHNNPGGPWCSWRLCGFIILHLLNSLGVLVVKTDRWRLTTDDP